MARGSGSTVVGISAFYHDAAVAIVSGGIVRFAASEERFSRVKHHPDFPARALAAGLHHCGLSGDDVDAVVFYDKPLLTFERVLDTWLDHAPQGFGFFAASAPEWLGGKLLHKPRIRRALRAVDPALTAPLLFSDHHRSHAASAYFPSPFADAAVLTLDGVGEWATASIQHGRGDALIPLRELRFPHSLGLLYAAFTAHCGFRVNGGEYKLMGLAPYGTPRFADLILHEMMDLREDGSFQLDLSWFDWCRSAHRMTTDRFSRRVGPARAPGEPLRDHHRDLAASIQLVTEEIVLRMAREAHRLTGSSHLCLAGGVALNGVANGRVLREGPFQRLWIQPAAGDAGGALGAALIGAYHLGDPRTVCEPDAMETARLGPDLTTADATAVLDAHGVSYTVCEEPDLVAWAADRLASGRTLGWCRGRMEFGPRALGNRSILADPRDPAVRDRLNAQVKHRESFRPFAPVVPEELAADWFELDQPSPTMGLVVRARRPDRIPAAVHVDGTARVQTVSRDQHPRLHALLHACGERTGVPVLINTSFNVAGEPIVCTAADAWRCFAGTDLDDLVLDRCCVSQDPRS